MKHSERGAPYLIEKYGGFITYWFCEPPPWGSTFQVLRDHWRYAGVTPIREVYEIRLSIPTARTSTTAD